MRMARADENLQRSCDELRRLIAALHLEATGRSDRAVVRALALLHSALDELEGDPFYLSAGAPVNPETRS
jgi:hypothetical protein